ncbi:TatD family hydrolase [Ferruginivarius sediminum]|uniref:TatD family deoxyribonuclease n=1 Tax=Ferruginivarius sediminum TaxID=2661937 RepID=A0A369TAX9_9PROT|nr:TatD family hydrolase [Ferruginivarius sediminum]RDD62032.1 TatD family deoxyribonuclease [Ferruginivarius sediminum]
MLVDSHCHLDMVATRDDLDEVVARANRAGVATMVTISTTLSGFADVLAIAKRCEDVWCSVGVHPHEAGSEGQSAPDRVVELAADPFVVGIGESGLDYYYDKSPRPAQEESFRAHIRAAQQTGLPLIVHSRDAEEDTARILREEYEGGGPYGCVMHCFSSGRELAEAALDLGFYISFSGIVTFKKSDELRDIASMVPRERLLIETDAPYLAPVPKRGKPNEPAYLSYTADFLAEHLGMSREELAETTTANFFRLFNRARPPQSA